MSASTPPLVFTYDGEALIPRVPRLADKYYVVGETYSMVPHEARSAASHAHFFAALAEAHSNLPDDAAERFATVEHLRKYALIKAGFRDERSIPCSSKAEAQRIAAFIKPMDDFAIVVAQEALVTVFTAKSQSMRAMGRPEFEKSKQAVLDIVASMIGVSNGELKANAGRAA